MSPVLLAVAVFLGIITAGTGVGSILLATGTLSLVSAQQFFATLAGEAILYAFGGDPLRPWRGTPCCECALRVPLLPWTYTVGTLYAGWRMGKDRAFTVRAARVRERHHA